MRDYKFFGVDVSHHQQDVNNKKIEIQSCKRVFHCNPKHSSDITPEMHRIDTPGTAALYPQNDDTKKP